jgi:hypothetical protein
LKNAGQKFFRFETGRKIVDKNLFLEERDGKAN